MKKIAVLFMIISAMLALCACNGTDVKPTEPSEAVPVVTQPQENVTIDWETPIDIDDSFLEETTGDAQEPVDTTPTTGPNGDATEPTENPTEENAEPTEGNVDPTEPSVEVTEPPKTNSSGAIELPMIPG